MSDNKYRSPTDREIALVAVGMLKALVATSASYLNEKVEDLYQRLCEAPPATHRPGDCPRCVRCKCGGVWCPIEGATRCTCGRAPIEGARAE